MNITLNSSLVAVAPSQPHDISHSIVSVARSAHNPGPKKSYELIQGNALSVLRNTGFMGLLSHCYSRHLPVAIAPHDIWVVLMSEIAKEVAQHPEQYRSLFTQSDKKETISVESGSMTEMPMAVLSAALSRAVLFDSSVVMPEFSTQSPMVSETLQAIFCDMASPFYDYGMFCCGIPSIKILGTPEDWEKVASGMQAVAETFKTPSVRQYTSKVQPILEQFVRASNQDVDTDFWMDIFTQENVGSGGDLQVNGWVTQLFMKEHGFAKITNFTATHGIVKYTQLQTKEEFVAVYGGFNAQEKDGFYVLEYSKFVLQKVDSKW